MRDFIVGFIVIAFIGLGVGVVYLLPAGSQRDTAGLRSDAENTAESKLRLSHGSVRVLRASCIRQTRPTHEPQIRQISTATGAGRRGNDKIRFVVAAIVQNDSEKPVDQVRLVVSLRRPVGLPITEVTQINLPNSLRPSEASVVQASVEMNGTKNLKMAEPIAVHVAVLPDGKNLNDDVNNLSFVPALDH